MFDIDIIISKIDNLLKKYYPYSVFIAGLFVFISVTALIIYLGKQATIALALKDTFSNIREVYAIIGATVITIGTLTNRYKEEGLEVNGKFAIALAIINTIIFILIALLIFLGFSEDVYKILMLVYLIFIASLNKMLKIGYINIFEKFKKKI